MDDQDTVPATGPTLGPAGPNSGPDTDAAQDAVAATVPAATAPGDPHPAPSAGLSAEQAAVLELEQQWWKYQGAKETAVLERFGWTLTRYYQVLNALIDTPEALAHDPLTVSRLRRLRAERQRARRAPDAPDLSAVDPTS